MIGFDVFQLPICIDELQTPTHTPVVKWRFYFVDYDAKVKTYPDINVFQLAAKGSNPVSSPRYIDLLLSSIGCFNRP